MKTMSENHRNVIEANAQEMHTSLAPIPDSMISSFFNGKSIFITGATGFMGKVLVEKLLRSCPDLKSIFVLLRTKKNMDHEARLNELLNSKIFDRVRGINATLLNKVIMIPGDIVLPGLGISPPNIELLCRDVSIVFHSAATVKFDEPMRTSINFNALGTRNMLVLCRKMKKLETFLHVSTAYSNCDRFDVDEQFYPIGVPYEKVIELNEWMDDETLEAVTPKLLGKRPNTYTYTKALAEALLFEESGSIPVAIVRPSIVTASWREPYPGWVDNINGPTGMILASGKGLLRTMLYDSKACADFIPVDMVINLMITVAWFTATRRPNNIRIYNCTSGSLNKLMWKDIEKIGFPLLIEYPSLQLFRYPGVTFKESRIYHQICCFFDHIIPAYVLDGMRIMCFRKPILIRIYQKLHRAIEALEYFTKRGWNFKSSNVLQLSEELQGIDQKEFHFDVRNLNWRSYLKNYMIGIRRFILKEDDSTLPKARRNLKRMYYIEKMVYLLFILLFWYTTTSGLQFMHRIFPATIDDFLQSSAIISPDSDSDLVQKTSSFNSTNQSIRIQSISSSILSTLASIVGVGTSPSL